MAKYRQIHTSFWQDGFIQDLTPEERYFYIYLMTNTKTNQSGIYELPVKNIQYETGLEEEKIKELIEKFSSWKKIEYSYETKEIFMLNWLKYNPITNDNLQKCVKSELKCIKNATFLRSFINGLEPYVQADFKPLIRGLQGATHTLPSKGVKNKEQRIKNKEQRIRSKEEGEDQPVPTPDPEIKIAYAENVKLTVLEYQHLVKEHGQTDTDEMIQSMHLYKGSSGKKYKSDFYTLQNWFRRDAKEKTSPKGPKPRQNGNFEQRDPDEDLIEALYKNPRGK